MQLAIFTDNHRDFFIIILECNAINPYRIFESGYSHSLGARGYI